MDIKGAAIAVHIAMSARLIPYAVAGRYAVELLYVKGPDGPEYDSCQKTLTIIVDCDEDYAINVLLDSGEPFAVTSSLGLVYDPHVGYISADPISIEIHQSHQDPYLLPWISWSPKLCCSINSVLCMQVLHPKVFVIAMARLWNFAPEHCDAKRYLADVVYLLQWLVEKKMEIDFNAYRGPRKRVLLMTFSTLYSLCDEVRGLLQSTMRVEDFVAVRDDNIPYY
ncbi:predicted protein [Uncinocarpus reesii 1704]|uniref:Uncharacterized protein n=1 Tax=Uncinocarpus reesii (strain UAMH 1704) TaxID=336963 RepID=C4JU23_UNCRE|nr:uncharacterized protein UREG_05962 [Uncinocarpus reesii 1704]EEP81120.1 predicted protein [Uncinocarpus reesii 1704]